MFQRYAIYYTPSGALAEVGASWLGWDIKTGTHVPHPVIDGLDVAALTQRPRKYGLHGTIKPPFALADGTTEAMLTQDFEALCARLAPVAFTELETHPIGPFIALAPIGDQMHLDTGARRLRTKSKHIAKPYSQNGFHFKAAGHAALASLRNHVNICCACCHFLVYIALLRIV